MQQLNFLPSHWYRFILDAETVTLLNLSPAAPVDGGLVHPSLNRFTAGIVRTAILGSPARSGMVEAIKRGIAEATSRKKCFYPHHFLEAAKNGQELNLSICFECCLIRGGFVDEYLQVPTSRFSESVFDEYFPEYKAAREFKERLDRPENIMDVREIRSDAGRRIFLSRVEAIERKVRAAGPLDNKSILLDTIQEYKDMVRINDF